MRIGLDLDGVFCNFTEAYIRVVREVAGVDLFEPTDATNPPVWYFPEYRGYSKDVIKEAWKRINTDTSFWYRLATLPGAQAFLAHRKQTLSHDVYFLTNRSGVHAKLRTEQWCSFHLYTMYPTVLITSDKTGVDKGWIAKALKLDCYIDDKLENVKQVCELSPKTRTYLLDYAYNQDNPPDTRYTRVSTVNDFFIAEGL